MKNLNWEGSFKRHFHESWHPYMERIITSDYMAQIYAELKARRERILPESSSDIFKVFKHTVFPDIKAVIVLSDPYPWVKNGIVIADGIPMGCSNSMECQPTLVQWYGAMERELQTPIYRDPDLTYLLHQGILLLNSSLTVKLNKVSSHSTLWLPFMQDLLENVLSLRNGTTYWLLGEEAKRLEKWISPLGNYIFKGSHPASAAHKHQEWDTGGMFTKMNKIISGNFGESYKIVWDSKELERQINSCPF